MRLLDGYSVRNLHGAVERRPKPRKLTPPQYISKALSNSKLKKTEIFIKHKIQSASAFYHSVSYPNFIAYVAKEALIGPKNRAIFLIELNCQSDKQKAVYAFNQIFGACSEDQGFKSIYC